ncbi:S8 family serine peptidase [Candidatus Dependentiae bacterium]|nr:S8 family serine peptidase [Candidatus Dependentiae bacterium]
MKKFTAFILFFLITGQLVYAAKFRSIKHSSLGEIAENQLLAKFVVSEIIDSKIQAYKTYGGIINTSVLSNNTVLFEFDSSSSFDKFYNIFKSDTTIIISQPNYVYKSCVIPNPNDDDYDIAANGKQWGLGKIKANNAWEIDSGLYSNIIIAVLDTGIDTNHPDLKNKTFLNTYEIPGNGIDDDNNGYIDDYNGFNFVGAFQTNGQWQSDTNFPDMFDIDGHGTWCSLIIGAETDNDTFGAGVIWGGKILPVRCLGADDDGRQIIGTTSTLVEGIYYAVKIGAKVINMSLGSSDKDSLEEQAVNYAYAQNIVLIAAAGNNNSNNDYSNIYPSDFSNVISVGASDISDNRADFSNYGWNNVNIFAPGTNIYFPKTNGSIEYWNGTSASAPFVSGVAALLFSYNPNLKPWEIKDILIRSADYPVLNDPASSNKGRLNAYNALKMVQLNRPVIDKDKRAVINFPNPFKKINQWDYVVFRPAASTKTLEIKIYNLSGQLIKTLSGTQEINDFDGDGSLDARWYGDSIYTSSVSPGTYMFYAKTDYGKWTEKLTVINW